MPPKEMNYTEQCTTLLNIRYFCLRERIQTIHILAKQFFYRPSLPLCILPFIRVPFIYLFYFSLLFWISPKSMVIALDYLKY